MKKITVILMFITSLVYSQMQDLGTLANGEIVGFRAIFDTDDDLYGYMALFSNGFISDNEKSFEYVLLDKNLNKVANNEFTSSKYTYSFSPYINFKGELILVPRVDPNSIGFFSAGKFVYPEVKKVDIENNTISKKFYYCYENGEFEECPENKELRQYRKEERNERREKGYVLESNLGEFKYGGFLLFQYEDHKKFTKNNKVVFFDEAKNKKWTFEYNTNGDKKNNESINYIDYDENYLYGVKTKTVKKDKSFYFIVLDLKTGELAKEEKLSWYEDINYQVMTGIPSQTHYIESNKNFEDKIVFLSKYYDSLYNNIGFIRWIIHKEDLRLESDFIKWTDLKNFIPKIKFNGQVEKKYQLDVKDVFFMEDGSTAMLFEKLKYSQWNGAAKNTDLVYLYTDKDFRIKSVETLEKEKSRFSSSDYLFSQYLHDDKDVVFFYQDFAKDDETKEKNWNLFINTLINGEFQQEMIPISSEENLILPYVAKEGYILLREYNEKDKYNQIRLEKLNF